MEYLVTVELIISGPDEDTILLDIETYLDRMELEESEMTGYEITDIYEYEIEDVTNPQAEEQDSGFGWG